ncbi:hypothetical protein [Flavobacterium aquidurense]|uniref:hypothetical protein n=1 Tax=Flavobacterium aquidurense TaxID=362413 RepID=UPI002861321F|nr:hypothetical protein [Flavobacterium aquidurense]MDR7372120.1 uncharacterized protein YegP (UPF0339 family) [Flavobacterium aquidurense]
MKKHILIFSSIVILFSCCNKEACSETLSAVEKNITHPKPPKTDGPPRILFIGNSQTEYFVSTPILFKEFCNVNNLSINIDQLITAGVSLKKVYETNKTEANQILSNKDKDGNYYDYAVIQESTIIALSEIETYKANVKMIVEKIHKNSPDVAVYIYQGISPASYTNSDFIKYHNEMRKNAISVMRLIKNAGLLRVGDAVKDAYDGKNGYKYLVANKDNLRYGKHTLHLINDGGFIQATLLFATIFDKKPIIPKKLLLITGTKYYDNLRKQEVVKAISNPNALKEIAFNNR